MNLSMESLAITLNSGNASLLPSETYEAAIKHFINQLPKEKRPKEGETIDVARWIHNKVELNSN